MEKQKANISLSIGWRQLLLVIYCFGFSQTVYSSQSTPSITQRDDSAVILMYHNISSTTHPSTSVTPEKFKRHIRYLADNDYTVWPLFKTLVHLSTNQPIPNKTIALTFDDAYLSVYTEAFPLLKKQGWPFTVFVTAKYITEGYNNFMSWQQLREIKDFGGDVGNHSFTHPHLVRQYNNETNAQWQQRIINELGKTQYLLQQNVGDPVPVVAYPYGEYSLPIKNIVRTLGYFGLGQHSGAVSRITDFQAIPRFPIATGFDDIESFATKVSAKNLPVTTLSSDDGLVRQDKDIPALTIRLGAGDYKHEAFACYATEQGRIKTEWLDKENFILTIRANNKIKSGRTKYNCTAPSKTEDGVFYWFSYLWMKPEADGSWYKE